MVEGAALEMLCPERDLGFESLTLRHEKVAFCLLTKVAFFMISVPGTLSMTNDITNINNVTLLM